MYIQMTIGTEKYELAEPQNISNITNITEWDKRLTDTGSADEGTKANKLVIDHWKGIQPDLSEEAKEEMKEEKKKEKKKKESENKGGEK